MKKQNEKAGEMSQVEWITSIAKSMENEIKSLRKDLMEQARRAAFNRCCAQAGEVWTQEAEDQAAASKVTDSKAKSEVPYVCRCRANDFEILEVTDNPESAANLLPGFQPAKDMLIQCKSCGDKIKLINCWMSGVSFGD